MVDDQALNSDFNWGDAVTVRSDAPCEYRPSNKGSVCAIFRVDSPEQSGHLGHPIGTILCSVEFNSGDTIDVPEQFLKLADD